MEKNTNTTSKKIKLLKLRRNIEIDAKGPGDRPARLTFFPRTRRVVVREKGSRHFLSFTYQEFLDRVMGLSPQLDFEKGGDANGQMQEKEALKKETAASV